MRFRFGDHEVDAGRFLLTRGGEPVTIEPRPLQLLIHLLERHPEAVPKDALLDALWPDTAVTEGSLTRAVREVRRALRERADESGTIRTLRGRGYAIGCEVERVGDAEPGPEKGQRQLLALLSADAAGYSRLLAEDEASTVAALEAAREAMGARVVGHGGRVVDAVGDNLLARFPSAVEAVRAAVSIQEALDGGSLPFRIGVHLGEVLESEGNLYGDAVNVAARLERLARPRGLCVSDVVAAEVRGRIAIEWEDAGEQRLKNIARPVRAYRTLGDAEAAAPPPAGSEADEPDAESAALVVLPFQNLTGNPEREFIADGLTEELTTVLSRNPHITVISRSSAFTYKGKAIRIPAVRDELGVRYVLEGSLRESPSRLRFTLQLIDAVEDEHVWAQNFDAGADALGDLIALQEDMADRVLGQMGDELGIRERTRARPYHTSDRRAYEAMLRGWSLLRTYARAETGDAGREFARAIELDPDYAAAHALLGTIRALEYWNGWRLEPEVLASAEACAIRALELDPGHPDALSLLAFVRLLQGRLDEAAEAARNGLSRNPNLFEAFGILAQIEGVRGDYAAAERQMERARRVNPMDDSPLLVGEGLLAYRAGRREEAAAVFERLREAYPDALMPRIALAAHHALTGRPDLSRAVLDEARAISPKLTAAHAAFLIVPDPEHFLYRALEAGLRVAGLP